MILTEGVYGVDVEVVEGPFLILFRLVVRLVEPDVIEAVPLEEHLAGLDVDLLGDPVEHHAVYRATHTRQIPLYFAVDGYKGCILGCYEELVMVSLIAVASPHPGYLPVRMVADHVLTLAVAGVETLPPGKNRLALVGLHLEVESVPRRITVQGMKPYWLAPIVEDHRRVL